MRQPSSWDDQSTHLAGELATLRRRISRISVSRSEISTDKLDNLDEEKIQVIRDEIAALETQVENLNRNLGLDEAALPPLSSNIDSREKQIHQRQRNERAAADKQAAEDMAKLVVDVLNGPTALSRPNRSASSLSG